MKPQDNQAKQVLLEQFSQVVKAVSAKELVASWEFWYVCKEPPYAILILFNENTPNDLIQGAIQQLSPDGMFSNFTIGMGRNTAVLHLTLFCDWMIVLKYQGIGYPTCSYGIELPRRKNVQYKDGSLEEAAREICRIWSKG